MEQEIFLDILIHKETRCFELNIFYHLVRIQKLFMVVYFITQKVLLLLII